MYGFPNAELGIEKGEVKPLRFEARDSVGKVLVRALAINDGTIDTILRQDIPPPLSYLHVWLAFLYASMLSGVTRSSLNLPRVSQVLDGFQLLPREELEELEELKEKTPLPEDYAMRGLAWASRYPPKDWFQGDERDEEEKIVEGKWMTEARVERCAWLGARLVEKPRS